MPDLRQEDDPAHDVYVLLSTISDLERRQRIDLAGLAAEHTSIVEARNRLDAILAGMIHRRAA